MEGSLGFKKITALKMNWYIIHRENKYLKLGNSPTSTVYNPKYSLSFLRDYLYVKKIVSITA